MKVANKSIHVIHGQPVEPTPVNVRRNMEAACRAMYIKGLALERLLAEWPAGEPLPVTAEFRQALLLVIRDIKDIARIE